MKKNIGIADQVLRISGAILIGVLDLANVISGTLAQVLLALAVYFIFTGLLNFCPLYFSFGFSTRKKTE